jgi:hypothetical protein
MDRTIMGKSIKRTSAIAILILVVLLLAFCVTFAPYFTTDKIGDRYPNSTGAFQDHGDYKINSIAIIASLDQGDTDVFMPPSLTPASPVNEVVWHQTDILKVVNALNQHVWNDTLVDWKVYEVLLSTSCENYSKGFEAGRITFFKTAWLGATLNYVGRSVTLSTQFDLVTWGGGTYFPHPIIGWQNYDLRKFKVTADDAVRIADENGGKEFRANYANQCSILVSAINNVGWEVRYDNGSSYFVLEIDSYSGAVK